jgi:hypothetical protein
MTILVGGQQARFHRRDRRRDRPRALVSVLRFAERVIAKP